MTDEQIIKTLKNINEHCTNHSCISCKFLLESRANDHRCQIQQLTNELSKCCPELWNIEGLERIIKQ